MTISSSKSLRVCCYGSSSDRTPEKYKSEAYILGSLLASRGHVCVNGAGSYGCMGAMNEGAAAADGRIVGVIHGMFEVDGDDAHPVFKNATEDDDKIQLVRAYGDDLQERKKLLIKDADALMVLPGGAGTWDEVRELFLIYLELNTIYFNMKFYYLQHLFSMCSALGNGLCHKCRLFISSYGLCERGRFLRTFPNDAGARRTRSITL